MPSTTSCAYFRKRIDGKIHGWVLPRPAFSTSFHVTLFRQSLEDPFISPVVVEISWRESRGTCFFMFSRRSVFLVNEVLYAEGNAISWSVYEKTKHLFNLMSLTIKLGFERHPRKEHSLLKLRISAFLLLHHSNEPFSPFCGSLVYWSQTKKSPQFTLLKNWITS